MRFANFKQNVPETLQNKIHDVTNYILDNFRDMTGRKECMISPEVLQDIEGNAISGWIPHQDGGFQVSGFFQNDCDSSYHFTEKQTDYCNDQSQQCWDSFLQDNDLPSGIEWNNLTHEQQNEYMEYENNWFEPALLQFQCFCDGFSFYDDGKRQYVTFRVSINYKDAPYYREKYAEDIKSVIYTAEEFMQLTNEEINNEFTV